MDRVIDHYRKANGVGYADWCDFECVNCLKHTWAMVKRNELYHAESHYLNGWCEAVAMCSLGGSFQDALYKVVFEILGTSKDHRNVMLMPYLACNSAIYDGNVWTTVRGRR